MLPLTLRLILIFFSICFIIFVITKVNQKKLQTQFSLIWLFIAFSLIIISLFPQIIYFLSDLFGFEVSSNLVYLLGIVYLLFIQLNSTIKLSKQADDIKNIVQNYGIDSFIKEYKDEK